MCVTSLQRAGKIFIFYKPLLSKDLHRVMFGLSGPSVQMSISQNEGSGILVGGLQRLHVPPEEAEVGNANLGTGVERCEVAHLQLRGQITLVGLLLQHVLITGR
jgi:hypothetical protein